VNIYIAAAATAITAALTGCSAGPVSGTATAPPAAPSTAEAEEGVWGRQPPPLASVEDGGADLDAAARLGMDRARAASAARRGYPFAAAVSGDGRNCPVILRLPSGQLWWSPPMVTITGAGVAMTALPADATAVPAGCVAPSGPPVAGPVDTAAAAAAAREGRPYIAAIARDVDGCHVQVLLPGVSEPLGLDDITAGKDGGALVSGMTHLHACAWR
jgi:hypothetical protein